MWSVQTTLILYQPISSIIVWFHLQISYYTSLVLYGSISPGFIPAYVFSLISFDLYIFEQDFLKLEYCSLGSTLGITISLCHLHKHTWEIIHTDILKSTLKISKLQTSKSRIENQLRQEKVENRAHQAQIKKLQTDLLLVENEADKGVGTKRLLKEKEDTIQLLKKSWRFQLLNWSKIQSYQSWKERERERLNGNLTDYQSQLLKFIEKEK